MKGDPAPFSGTVLNDAALAKIITDAEAKGKVLLLEVERLKKELELEKRKAEAVCQAKLEGAQKLYGACSADADRVRGLLEKASNPPWYKSPYLHFLLGSAISGGVCAAATRIK